MDVDILSPPQTNFFPNKPPLGNANRKGMCVRDLKDLTWEFHTLVIQDSQWCKANSLFLLHFIILWQYYWKYMCISKVLIFLLGLFRSKFSKLARLPWLDEWIIDNKNSSILTHWLLSLDCMCRVFSSHYKNSSILTHWLLSLDCMCRVFSSHYKNSSILTHWLLSLDCMCRVFSSHYKNSSILTH